MTPTARARAARGAVMMALVAGLVVGARGVMPAHAESATGGDCMTGWRSEGFSTAMGQALDLPYETLVGEPWASSLIDDTPRSESRASLYDETSEGEVVIGTTSKGTPDNPFEARALYPAPGGGLGESHANHDYGAMHHSEASARPGAAVGDARVLGASTGSGSGLGAQARSEAVYTGEAIHGSNMSAAYDIELGGLHIALMRSTLQWKSDGTDAGTVATYTVEFHGVTAGGKPVTSSSGDGFTFSDQSPSPGPAAHKQFEDQARQFSEAVDKAGAGEYRLVVGDGRLEVSAGQIDVDEIGLKAEGSPSPFKASAVQGANWQFGRTVEQVTTSRGPCDAVKPLPSFSDSKSTASAPSVPQPPGAQYRQTRTAVRWTAADTIGSFRRTAVAAL